MSRTAPSHGERSEGFEGSGDDLVSHWDSKVSTNGAERGGWSGTCGMPVSDTVGKETPGLRLNR